MTIEMMIEMMVDERMSVVRVVVRVVVCVEHRMLLQWLLFLNRFIFFFHPDALTSFTKQECMSCRRPGRFL